MPHDDEHETHNGARHEPLAREMLSARTILISKPVDDQLARQVYQALILMEKADANAPITAIINSPGGSADSGFGIYDMLRFVRPEVRTIVAGLCASAAVPIFLGGRPGKRYSFPHSRFLLHQPSTQAMGQASDIEITAREIERIKEKYNRIVAEATGKKEKDVASDADRDFWLDADEAVKYGLVTKIVAHRGEME